VSCVLLLLLAILSPTNTVYANDKGADATVTLKQVIDVLDTELQAMINEGSGDDENVEIHYSGDMNSSGDRVKNWRDVLSVYMVKAEITESVQPDTTLTPAMEKTLREVFQEMNIVTIAPEQTSTEKRAVNVSVLSLNYKKAAKKFEFDKPQKKRLAELMSSKYDTMFDALLGAKDDNDETSDDLNNNLTASKQGKKIVDCALSRLGDPYVYGASGGDDSVDCSLFVHWAYKQADVSIPRTSVGQAEFCKNKNVLIEQKQLKPGDLLFWSKTGCQ